MTNHRCVSFTQVAALALAGLAGCLSNIEVGKATSGDLTTGSSTSGSGTSGSIGLGQPGDSGVTATDPNPCEVDLNFGNVAIGSSESAVVDVVNAGPTALNLTVSGVIDPEFALNGTQQAILAGGSGQFSVTFAPDRDGDVVSTLTIPTNGVNPSCPAPASSGNSTLTVQLLGNGMAPSCFALQPSSLDFGSTLINATAKKSVMLTNACTAPITGIATAVMGGDSSLFVVDNTPSTLAAGESASVDISYSPLALETRSLASVTFTASDGVPKATLSLSGEPVAGALTVSPNPIAFGYVPLSTTAIGCTTVSNGSGVPITISGLGSFESAGGSFALATTDDANPPNPFSFPVAIAGGGSARICFTLTPPVTQQFTGQVTLLTNDPSGVDPVIQLTGWAGGPQIVCTPLTLAFDSQTLTLPVTCINSGTALPGLQLTIGPLDISPAVFTAAFDTTTNPYPEEGLPPGQRVQIDVTYTPVDGTSDFGVLVIHNNGGQGQTPYISLCSGSCGN